MMAAPDHAAGDRAAAYAHKVNGRITLLPCNARPPAGHAFLVRGRRDFIELAVETLGVHHDGGVYIQGVDTSEGDDKAQRIASFASNVERYL